MPNPGKSNFFRKAKKKGHYETKERFKALPFHMLENTAWRSLNGNSIKIYLEICRRYNGSNNGDVSFSYNEGVDLFGMGKSTISRSLKQLEEFGFIKRNKVGTFIRRQASTYFITNERTDNTPPTSDWKNFLSVSNQYSKMLMKRYYGPKINRREFFCIHNSTRHTLFLLLLSTVLVQHINTIYS